VRSLGVEPPLYLQERLALSRADRIMVLSEFSRQLVLDASPAVANRIAIVGGGVDTGVFDPAPDRDALRLRLGVTPEQKLIVSARRLVGRMGLEMLLSAFRALHDEDDRTRLFVIGDGELRQALEAQRDDLRLAGSVKFTGRVSDGDLRDWYRAADLFVLPTIAYEGFGMVTAEALSCGTPVVGTPVGATGEILTPLNRELLAADASASSLLCAMRNALAWSDPAARANCRQYAQEHLSWARVLDRWEQELLQLPAQTACPHRSTDR
jgi:glycosyltransferase involved in cell wall biosynthesis